MPSPWNNLLTRGKAWWAGQDPGRRWRWVTAAVLGAAVAVAVGRWASNPRWTPIYTNLSPAAAGAMTQVLQQAHMPYLLASGGSTIEVPAAQVALARVTLAEHNLPASGSASFPQTPHFTLGETQQEIQLTQQAQLEQTLAATIRSMQGVTQARVLITEPPPSLFGESGTAPTASVFLALAPGASLTPTQVGGIEHLVAAAVPGMVPSHVTVVDQTGTLLTAAPSSSPGAQAEQAATSELAATQAVDRALTTQAQTLLDRVFGPGAAVARVQAQLNFQSATQTTTQYAPKGTITSQEVTTQRSASQGAPTPPAAGVTGNTPTYPTLGATGPSQSQKAQTITHYAVTTTKSTVSTPPGGIQRLTVAVAVDRRLSAAQIRQVQALISQAVGANPARGDVVTVTSLPFSNAAAQAAQQALQQAKRAQQIREAVTAGAGLALAAILFLFWRRRRKPAAVPAPSLAVETPVPSVAEAAEAPALATQVRLRERLQEWAAQDPDATARVVRSLIEGDL